MTEPDLAGLADLWRWCADSYADSPLYVAIARGVAEDPELIGLTVEAGTAHARFPNVLMAAVHELVLLGQAPELAEVYAGRSSADPFTCFRAAALEHREALLPRLADRFTNTNEVGRSALLAPVLAHVTADMEDWALVEVGASAGVNLVYDRYRLDYGPSGAVGDPAAPVHLACEDRTGTLPVPATMPVPAVRVGLDRDPIDLTDPDERRWLLACTWPDTDRIDRAGAAHEVVAATPPRIVTGDAVADLPALLATTAPELPVVVLTTWVVCYLPPDQRRALRAVLAEASRTRPVTWVTGEGIGVVPLAGVDGVEGDDGNILGATRFVAGAEVAADALARCHPHGRWVEWTTDGPADRRGGAGRPSGR